MKAVPLTNAIQRVGLASKNSRLFILGEREDFLRPQSNRENRPAHDGRNDTFEAAAIEREFGFENRPLMVHYRTLPGGNGIESTGRLGRRHVSNMLKTLAHPFHPKRGIRIEDDIFGSLIVEQTRVPCRPVRASIWLRDGYVVHRARGQEFLLIDPHICVVFLASGGYFPLLCRSPRLVAVTESSESFVDRGRTMAVITIPSTTTRSPIRRSFRSVLRTRMRRGTVCPAWIDRRCCARRRSARQDR